MKKIKEIVTFCAVFFSLCITLTGCGSKEINLNDYLTVTFSGYDGYGSANIVFDYEKFEEDCASVKISNSNVAALYGNAADYYRDFCFSYSLRKEDSYVQSNLANGEVVKLVWECDDGLVKNNTSGILSYQDMEIEVSGLETAPTIDLFESIEVTFQAVVLTYAPWLDNSSIIAKSNEYPDIPILVSSDFSDYFAIGDTVLLTANISTDNIENIIDTYGGIPETLTYEYVIPENAPHFITSLSDIPSDLENLMDEAARGTISDYLLYDHTEVCDNTSVEKVGMALRVQREISSGMYFSSTSIYQVYCLTFPDGNKEYYGVPFNDILVSGEGEIQYEKNWLTGEMAAPQPYECESGSSLEELMDIISVENDGPRQFFETNISE